jgi:serpin B
MFFTANKLYIDSDFEFVPLYKRLLARSFNSAFQKVIFGKPVETAEIINSWVSNQTNGVIKELVVSSELSNDTRVVVVNALYFKAQWKEVFERPRIRNFSLNSVKDVSTDFITLTSQLNFLNSSILDAGMVELKFENTNVSMVLIVPNKRFGLSQLEAKLDKFDWTTVKSQMKSTTMKVVMPTFKVFSSIEFTESLTLVNYDFFKKFLINLI